MRLFSKDRKSLQFPANCDGYLQVPYSSSAQQQVGIFGHSGSFTFEAIVTPYDVNGNSVTTYNGTIKSLGQGAKGLDYLSDASRLNVEMVLFYNANVKVVLENTSTTTKNQPAEYAIKFYLTIGSTTTTITSPTVISSTIIDDSSLDPTNYIYDKHTPTFKNSGATVLGHVEGATDYVVVTAGHEQNFYTGQSIYNQAGNLVGVVHPNTFLGSGAVIVNDLITIPTPSAGGGGLWVNLNKDALYLDKAHHIAVSYNAAGGRMNIFYEGNLVASGVHGAGGKFSMAGSDINIGQQSDGASYADRRKSQFMGELHELVFLNRYKDAIGSIETLTPFFGDVLLYYDFEEANLNG